MVDLNKIKSEEDFQNCVDKVFSKKMDFHQLQDITFKLRNFIPGVIKKQLNLDPLILIHPLGKEKFSKSKSEIDLVLRMSNYLNSKVNEYINKFEKKESH